MEKIELKIPNLGEAESTEIIEVNIEPGKEVSLKCKKNTVLPHSADRKLTPKLKGTRIKLLLALNIYIQKILFIWISRKL